MKIFHVLNVLGVLLALHLPASAMETDDKDSYTVTGRVIASDTGLGMAGVRITSPDIQVAAMTDEQGDYEITLPSLDVPLILEAPDNIRLVVPIKGRREVDIVVSTAVERSGDHDAWRSAMGEVMLSNLTEGNSSLSDIQGSLLKGEFYSVKSSGAPGAGSTLFIRGLSSLNLAAQPLYVVDGVLWQMQEDASSVVDGYYNNPLNFIAPEDIERIQVLKNGTALWGAKAAGGVILIDTKRGRDVVTRIDARIDFGYQSPFKSLPMMDAEAYRTYATEVMRGMKADEINKLQFINDDPSKFYYNDTHNDTRWLNEINRAALMQNYNISVSGGDDIALYRFSLGYAQNDGNIEGTSFDRLNVRFNSDIHLTKRFSIAADIAHSQTNTQAIFNGTDQVRSPYYMALAKSPLYGPYQRNGLGMLTNRLSDIDELNVGNPLVLVQDRIPSLNKYRFNLNLTPTYDINERMKISAILGLSWDKSNENLFIPDVGVADVPLYNQQGEIYATALNEVRSFMARNADLSADVHFDWNILSNWRHHWDAVVGGRFYASHYKYTGGQGYNTGSDYMTTLSNTNSNLRWLSGFSSENYDGAWYLQTDYAAMSKYLLSLALSLNASSRYGSEAGGLALLGSQWAPFASAQVAWLVSSERFMQKLDFVNQLKLRASFDRMGNDRLPLYANRTYHETASFAQDAFGQVLAGIANHKLQWETTTRWTAGVDLSLFSERWKVSADFYTGYTEDLLTQKVLPEVAGLNYYWDNNGSMKNQGFEVSTKAYLVDTRNWKLSLGAMIGRYKNKIVSLPNGSFVNELFGGQVLTAEGQEAGVFYGYKALGVFADASEAEAAGLAVRRENGSLDPFRAGDMHFFDKDGNRVIDEEDRVVLGSPNPDFYGNFRLGIDYKRLHLEALFTGSYGNEAYNALRASLESGSAITNQTTSMENRWVADGQHTSVPRATYGDPMGNARFSDRWVEDASYLKLKQVSLAYDIPLRVSFIQNLNVWVSANNLLTFTKYLGADPEFSYSGSVLYQGVDAGLVPQSRSWQMGVRIGL